MFGEYFIYVKLVVFARRFDLSIPTDGRGISMICDDNSPVCHDQTWKFAVKLGMVISISMFLHLEVRIPAAQVTTDMDHGIIGVSSPIQGYGYHGYIPGEFSQGQLGMFSFESTSQQ